MGSATEERTPCEVEAAEWTERGVYWLDAINTIDRPRSNQRRNLRRPLTVAGHGARLYIERGSLVVWGGFSHYPQARETWRFWPGDQRRPSRLFLLDGSGSITFDALDWLAEQDVPLIRLDYRGRCVATLGSHETNPDLQLRQLALVQDEQAALRSATRLVARKLATMLRVLMLDAPTSPSCDAAIETISFNLKVARSGQVLSIDALLGIEGVTAAVYWRSWHEVPIRWKGLSGRPIPSEWHQVGPRQSSRNPRNHLASHPVHAMLNYGYGLLESHVRIEIAAEGLNPSLGVLHRARPGRDALVLDLWSRCGPLLISLCLHWSGNTALTPAMF
jgi:CRISPR-associated protein Cas1